VLGGAGAQALTRLPSLREARSIPVGVSFTT
jgi:hypothetical protein